MTTVPAISDKARRLHREATFVNIHDHLMFEYTIRHALGEKEIFDTHYAPVLRQGGINVIATTVGANSPCMCNLSDYLEFGTFEQIDMLEMEQHRSETFAICRNTAEIENTVAQGKIAVLLAFEGARALEGRPQEESLCMLRTFYRLGLRVNCICGGGRTRFASGMGDNRSQAGVTTFGENLIREMNLLGVLIDLSHMNDRSFFDTLEISTKPVTVSHIGVQAVCPNPNNLSDERIKAIDQNGGVIGMEMVKTELKWGAQETGERVTFDTVIAHMDHIADMIGTDHIGIGLDFDNYELVHNIHRAMCPTPGSIEGFYTGIPKGDHMLDDPRHPGEAGVITEYMLRHGYTEDDIRKILGGNMMRLLGETLS